MQYKTARAKLIKAFGEKVIDNCVEVRIHGTKTALSVKKNVRDDTVMMIAVRDLKDPDRPEVDHFTTEYFHNMKAAIKFYNFCEAL